MRKCIITSTRAEDDSRARGRHACERISPRDSRAPLRKRTSPEKEMSDRSVRDCVTPVSVFLVGIESAVYKNGVRVRVVWCMGRKVWIELREVRCLRFR